MSKMGLLSTVRQLLIMRRGLNTKATKTNIANIFDRNAKRKQRNRAGSARDVGDYDLLKDKASTRLTNDQQLLNCIFQVAENMCSRLLDITRLLIINFHARKLVRLGHI